MSNGSKIIRGLQLLEQLNEGEGLNVDTEHDKILVHGDHLPYYNIVLEQLGWTYAEGVWYVWV